MTIVTFSDVIRASRTTSPAAMNALNVDSVGVL